MSKNTIVPMSEDQLHLFVKFLKITTDEKLSNLTKEKVEESKLELEKTTNKLIKYRVVLEGQTIIEGYSSRTRAELSNFLVSRVGKHFTVLNREQEAIAML